MAKAKDFEDNNNGNNPLLEMTQRAWSDGADPVLSRRGKRKERIEDIAIDLIVPDGVQPRRVAPAVVRARASNPRERIIAWAEMIGAREDVVASNVAGTDEYESVGDPLKDGFYRIVNLAGSIYRDGLTNPITVAQRKEQYLLETGERRLMAYHLLNVLYPAGEWQTIKARVVDAVDVWRQATENNVRESLNAVARARQFALLLMDLLREDGTVFKSMDAFEHEKDFYAQVVEHNVPYGRGGKLNAALGVSNRRTASRLRAILRVSPAVWSMADDYDIAEGAMRHLVDLPEEEAIEAIKAGGIVTIGHSLGDGGYVAGGDNSEDVDSVPTGNLADVFDGVDSDTDDDWYQQPLFKKHDANPLKRLMNLKKGDVQGRSPAEILAEADEEWRQFRAALERSLGEYDE